MDIRRVSLAYRRGVQGVQVELAIANAELDRLRVRGGTARSLMEFAHTQHATPTSPRRGPSPYLPVESFGVDLFDSRVGIALICFLNPDVRKGLPIFRSWNIDPLV